MEALFTIKEAAEKSRMSPAWWRMMIFKSKLRYLKVGRRVLIPESTLRNLLESSAVNPRA